MNKQRKVVITTTYNEMGIIIDTKVEEVAQPNLQPSCNHLATDTISRQAAIEALRTCYDTETITMDNGDEYINYGDAVGEIEQLPSAQPEIIQCKDCKHWIPYDWMFSEVWQSKNIADYPEDEIGCNCCDMAMKANDFCSRAERRTE